MPKQITKERFPGLNSLRFFACLFIFIAHSFTSFHIAFFGMNLFFVLSSFLLTYSALIEIENNSNFSRFNFFARRAIRIYPLYFAIIFGLICLAPLFLNTNNYTLNIPSHPLYYFFFISNYDPSDHIFALKFLWSISVEEQFYLLFIFFSYFFKNYFWLPICILIFGYFIYMFIADFNKLSTYMHTCTYFSNFAVGMIGGWFYLKKGYSVKFYLISMMLSFALCMLLWEQEVWSHLLIVICLMNLIGITIGLFTRYPILNKAFAIAETLGQYSYGLYALSGIVITIGLKYPITTNHNLQVVVNFIFLAALSAFSHHYYEAYFLKLKKFFKS
jgi:peptidoglycan/LPS O-acetylase OafA/YrhL